MQEEGFVNRGTTKKERIKLKPVYPHYTTKVDEKKALNRKKSEEFDYGDWNSEDEEIIPKNPLVFYF